MLTSQDFDLLFTEGLEAGRRWAASHPDSPALGTLRYLAVAAGDGSALGCHEDAAEGLEQVIGIGVIQIPVESGASAAIAEGFVAGAATE